MSCKYDKVDTTRNNQSCYGIRNTVTDYVIMVCYDKRLAVEFVEHMNKLADRE